MTKYALIFAVQMVMTAVAVVIINRKLLLQNIALRNQLGVYMRTIDKNKIRSQIRDRDRILWVLLKKILHDWSDFLVIVNPQTVINWERRRFTRFWRKKCKTTGKVGRPPITAQHIEFTLTLQTAVSA
jgi:hypothetical protein